MHIKRFYPKDERFFKVLSVSGNIRSTDANKLDISDTRLKNMVKDNLIKEIGYVDKRHESIKSQRCYTFTDKGKKFINKQYGIDRVQSPAAIRHNCKTAETICSLQPREIDSIRSEWQIRDQMMEEINKFREQGDYDRYDEYIEKLQEQKLSAIDYTYVNMQGVECGVEIITSSYGEEEIMAKEECGSLIQTEIHYISV